MEKIKPTMKLTSDEAMLLRAFRARDWQRVRAIVALGSQKDALNLRSKELREEAASLGIDYDKWQEEQKERNIMADTPRIMNIIPSLSRLQDLLENDANDVVQQLIDKHKLPYILVPRKDNPSKFEVKPDLTTGEKYLEQFITIDTETVE